MAPAPLQACVLTPGLLIPLSGFPGNTNTLLPYTCSSEGLLLGNPTQDSYINKPKC